MMGIFSLGAVEDIGVAQLATNLLTQAVEYIGVARFNFYATNKASIAAGFLVRRRLPALPLSQYHRRGKV